MAARTEAQIASSQDLPDPSTPSGQEYVSKLQQAASTEIRYVEDAYLTNVCVAGIYLLRNEYENVLRALPIDDFPSKAAGSRSVVLGWLEVAEVKAVFLRLAALRQLGRVDEARSIGLDAALRTPGSRTPELRLYTELLLSAACALWSDRAKLSSVQSLSQSLRCFMSWSDFWQRSPQNISLVGVTNSKFTQHVVGATRRATCGSHYELVSTILQRRLSYNISPSSPSDLLVSVSSTAVADDDYIAMKSKQKVAWKQAQMRYESLLLHETQFPKASQSNVEVEKWVEKVVKDWEVLNGPTWTDLELGDGGKGSLSRGVLDILYRAATKTFHSTPILRHLFKVHAAIGEFDLAMHAFNSYVEIVSKGKARAEKTGTHGTGLDSEDMVVLTAAEAVRLLCRYGDREHAEKAVDVGRIIQGWLAKAKPTSTEDAKTNSDDNRAKEALEPSQTTESQLQRRTLAAAYRAIGVGEANWARLTYDTAARSTLRSEALINLRRAQVYDITSTETAYALALVLAESRDIVAAMKVIKSTISLASQNYESDEQDAESADHGRERSLIPMWHLFGLCLTASDEYEAGMKMCEMALDQFEDENTLFGESMIDSSDGSRARKLPWFRRGVVDLMDEFEKESILQLRFSQLTFTELTEGPDAALEMSHELLSMYTRLFGTSNSVAAPTQKPPPTAASATPSKLGGTLRSIAGSVRPRSAQTSVERDPRTASHVSLPAGGENNTNAASIGDSTEVPISITVTNEDGIATEKSHHHRHLPFRRKERGPDRGHTLKQRHSFKSDKRPFTPVQQKTIPENAASVGDSPVSQSTAEGSASMLARPDQPLNEVAHNVPHHHWPPPPGHQQQPPKQDVRLPAPEPSSHLVPDARPRSARDRQHETSLLITVWLFIAGLYLRAELLDDAGSAINEASKLVESFEAGLSAEQASARMFYSKGWGGGRSVDNLWADILCSVSLAVVPTRSYSYC